MRVQAGIEQGLGPGESIQLAPLRSKGSPGSKSSTGAPGSGSAPALRKHDRASFDSAYGTAEVQELLMRRRLSDEQMLGLELGTILGRGSFGSVYQGSPRRASRRPHMLDGRKWVRKGAEC